MREFNRKWKPVAIGVPDGDRDGAWDSYQNAKVRDLRIHLMYINNAIDSYYPH